MHKKSNVNIGKELNKSKTYKDERDLYTAILNLETIEECFDFFHDLCAPNELKNLQERWKVCRLLAKGDLSYRDINKLTGISLTTIGRVARFLHDEQYHGYRLMLDRIEDKKETRHRH